MLVLCNGMIRSGSTIQYNLARELVERAGRGEGIGFIDHDADVDTARLDELVKGDTIRVAKTHRAVPGIEAYVRDGRAVLCFTYRHLLDVAGSAKTKFGWDWGLIVASIQEGIAVHELAESLPRALVQRYESLTDDLAAAAGELNDHLELGLSPEQVGEAADAHRVEKVAADLEQMQHAAARRESVKSVLRRIGLLKVAGKLNRALPNGLQYQPVIDTQTNYHHNHISKGMGRPGVSRQALTASEQADVVERFGDYLERYRYEADTPAAEELTHG